MVYYKPIKVIIDASGLAEVIIKVVVRHYGILDSIVTNRRSFFTSKFGSSLCYFFGIKQRLSTAFYPQTDGQTERQNSTIEADLQAFVNFEQNDWAWFLSMAEFAYNNAKNASTGHIFFEFNCGYHPCVSYKQDLNLRSKLKTAEELSFELQNLMAIYQQNLYHAQELQKQAHNKEVKPQSYALGKKVWLSSKHLKIKRNYKLENKVLGLFQVLHPVDKQAYKLELARKWKIYDVFHVSLLEQDTTKKGQVNDMQLNLEFDTDNNKKYEVKGIGDSAIYARESAG